MNIQAQETVYNFQKRRNYLCVNQRTSLLYEEGAIDAEKEEEPRKGVGSIKNIMIHQIITALLRSTLLERTSQRILKNMMKTVSLLTPAGTTGREGLK